MSAGRAEQSPESDYSSAMNLDLDETKLTLGLPGVESHGNKTGTSRGFSDTVGLSLGRSSTDGHGKAAMDSDAVDGASGAATSKAPASKTQVVGWPPVRSTFRRDAKFVKVAVDGAPYLRKVNLETYKSYEQLLAALKDMFSCFTICKYMNERKLMDTANGGEYVPTYEDKDGDWMLVGDVPWKMFVESCKRIRLWKGSEALGLAAPRGSASTRTSSSS